jgi:hypothetical protein
MPENRLRFKPPVVQGGDAAVGRIAVAGPDGTGDKPLIDRRAPSTILDYRVPRYLPEALRPAFTR